MTLAAISFEGLHVFFPIKLFAQTDGAEGIKKVYKPCHQIDKSFIFCGLQKSRESLIENLQNVSS